MEMPDLLLEGLVEGEFGNVTEDAVEDEGLDLLLRRAEFVKGIVDLFVEDLVLHGDWDLDEDVVVRLGLDRELSLLDLEIDEVDALGIGNEDMQPGANDAVEFAEALNHACGIGTDGKKRFEDGDEDDDGENEENSKEKSVHGFHSGLGLGSEDT